MWLHHREATPIFHVSLSHSIPGKERSANFPSYRLEDTTPKWETVWIHSSKSQITCSDEVSFMEGGRAAGNWGIQSVCPWKATGWDQDEVLSSFLQAWLLSHPIGVL